MRTKAKNLHRDVYGVHHGAVSMFRHLIRGAAKVRVSPSDDSVTLRRQQYLPGSHSGLKLSQAFAERHTSARLIFREQAAVGTLISPFVRVA